MTDYPAQQKLIAALLDPRLYPHGARKVTLVETHISWVLLAGRYAYKIKKAVNLGFLDFTTLESRKFYCEEELRLNRRLAPKIYLDVIPIGGSPDRPVLNAQPAIEYAVKMRRFASHTLMDRMLKQGLVTPQHMDSLAIMIARSHGGLPPAVSDSSHGTAASIRAAAMQNFEQLQPLLEDEEDRKKLATIRQLTKIEYDACEKVFAARRAQGCVRECHGDLHLGNIALIADKPVPFDGIEFSAELRWLDVMNEAAFPVMDLLQCGQPALAFRFLNAYLENGGDYAGVPVLRFYLAYHAMVRAKVAAIRASQPGLPKRAKTQALAACRNYLLQAELCLTRRHPALIITHGLPGSGKSTFAQIALEHLGAIRIRSDVERKRLFGLNPLDSSRVLNDGGARAGEHIYSREATQRTYARLHELARTILAAGFPVVVDAAFLMRGEREQFHELARSMNVPFAIASISAPDAVLRARITQRRAQAHDASEADVAVLHMLQAGQEPLTTQELACCVEFASAARNKSDTPQNWNPLLQLLA